MTNQEKKAELQKYRAADGEAAQLREEIIRLYSQSERMTTVLKLVPAGGGGDRKIEDAVGSIDELAVALGDKQREASAIRRRLEDAVAGAPDGQHRLILRYRYIDGMKWEQIEAQMNFGKTQIWRLHGEALSALKME